jgi:hypothetical protein
VKPCRRFPLSCLRLARGAGHGVQRQAERHGDEPLLQTMDRLLDERLRARRRPARPLPLFPGEPA